MDIERRRKNTDNKYMSEVIKWVGIVILFLVLVVGNYLYRDYYVVLRGLIVTIIFLVAMYIIYTTKIGKSLVIFGQESLVELKQVVWPTYKEGLQTTLIVVVVTVIVSLVLWGLDTIIVNIISFSLRL